MSSSTAPSSGSPSSPSATAPLSGPLASVVAFIRQRRNLLILMAVGVALGTWITRHFLSDDGIITLRYSRNLIDGHGPNWNIGGDRVEGYTSALFMFATAALGFLRIDLVVASKIIASLCLLGSGVVAARTLRGRTGSDTLAAIGALALTWSPALWLHIGTALETTVFGLIALSLLSVFLLSTSANRHWILAGLALLLAVTRPEGALLGGLFLLAELWFSKATWRKTLIAGIAAFIVPLGVYVLWRWSYYGYPLPNTVYVKGGKVGLGAVKGWLHANATIFIPLLLAGLYSARKKYIDAKTGVALLLPLIALMPYSASSLITDFFHRFLSLLFPVLLVAGLIVIHSLRTALERWALVGGTLLAALVGGLIPSRKLDAVILILLLVLVGTLFLGRRTTLTGVGAAALAVVILTGWYSVSIKPELLYAGRSLEPTYGAFGRALHAAPPTMKIAVGDAGAIPYYSRWQTFDIARLNEATATHGADPRAALEKFNPDLILVYLDRKGETPLPEQKGYLNLAGLETRYTRQGVLHLWRNKHQNYGLGVYSRTGDAALAALAQKALADAQWDKACAFATYQCAIKRLLA